MNEQPGGTFDPQIVLIEWFTTRTERRVLRWNVETEAITASVSLPPLVHVRFATRPFSGDNGIRWESFYVRRDNEELFRVESQDAADDSAAFAALNALFMAALKTTTPTI